MRKTVSFRFEKNTLLILASLEEALRTSKTDIIEKAVVFYAAKKLKQNNALMRHAGALSNEDADDMLFTIKKDRKNKKIKGKLWNTY